MMRNTVLVVLLTCGALLMQQGAGQRRDYRGSHAGGHYQGCHHGSHRREDATESRIYFDVDNMEAHQADDRRQGQGDPVPGNDMVNGNGVPNITLDNRNFIFAPAFNQPSPCPPGMVRITKTSPCRYLVRDAAPRGPVRPERGVCPTGMAKVGQWCREPYG